MGTTGPGLELSDAHASGPSWSCPAWAPRGTRARGAELELSEVGGHRAALKLPDARTTVPSLSVSFRQAWVIPQSSVGKLGYGAERRCE